jgi:hypothetical protein
MVAAISAMAFTATDYFLPKEMYSGDKLLLRWLVFGIVAYLTVELLSS